MAKDNENNNQNHQDEQQTSKPESKFKAPWNKKFGEDESIKKRQYSRAARNQPIKEATTLSKVLLFLLVITLLSPFILYWAVDAMRQSEPIDQRTTEQISIESSIANSSATSEVSESSSESESESESSSESVSSREIEESTPAESVPVESVPVETPPVTEPVPPVTEPVPPVNTGGGSYVVQAGDSWYGIATRYGIDVYTLAEMNGATIETPIYPGMEITVP